VPDYLAIGHICQDVIQSPVETPGAFFAQDRWYTFGGTVTYAARTAHALGQRVAVLTSAAGDLNLAEALPGIAVNCLPSASTTTFENTYRDGTRQQFVHAVAERITLNDVPAAWRQAAIVHLGPVAQEIDPAILEAFSGAFIGLTPQGWLRTWDEQGRVQPCAWENAQVLRVNALVLSIEDVGGDEALIAAWGKQAPVLVATQGARGATVYVKGQPKHIPAPTVSEVDPTGAGDIFAAAFFIRLYETGDPLAATHFAACLAAASVTRRGLDGIPTQAEIEQCRA
jgi:sugar/nucleoside kinase (ribokinase family)